MRKDAVYSKTAKGILELANRLGRVPKNLAKVLTLVDGKSTIGDLLNKATNLSEEDLEQALEKLTNAGYIRKVTPDEEEHSPAEDAEDAAEFSATDSAVQAGGSRRLKPVKGKAHPYDAEDDTEKRARQHAMWLALESEARAREEATLRQEEEDREGLERAAQIARHDVERLAREEAERFARARTELIARLDAERRAKEQAERLAMQERAAREQAERLAREKAALMARLETEVRAKAAAEQVALEERVAREETQRQAREQAERLAREETERLARQNAELLARLQAVEERMAQERQAREAAEASQREATNEDVKRLEAEVEAVRQAKRDAEQRAEAERATREQAERLAREEAQRLAQQEAARQAREESERAAREQAERLTAEKAQLVARLEAEERAKEEARRIAEEERRARAEAEERARAEAQLRLRAEEERREQERLAQLREQEERQHQEQEAARQRAMMEAEERLRQEAERAAAEERRQREEAERRVREEMERLAREKTELVARMEAEARNQPNAAGAPAGAIEPSLPAEEWNVRELEARRRAQEESERLEQQRRAAAVRRIEEERRRAEEEAGRQARAAEQRELERRRIEEERRAREAAEALRVQAEARRAQEEEVRRAQEAALREQEAARRAKEEEARRAKEQALRAEAEALRAGTEALRAKEDEDRKARERWAQLREEASQRAPLLEEQERRPARAVSSPADKVRDPELESELRELFPDLVQQPAPQARYDSVFEEDDALLARLGQTQPEEVPEPAPSAASNTLTQNIPAPASGADLLSRLREDLDRGDEQPSEEDHGRTDIARLLRAEAEQASGQDRPVVTDFRQVVPASERGYAPAYGPIEEEQSDAVEQARAPAPPAPVRRKRRWNFSFAQLALPVGLGFAAMLVLAAIIVPFVPLRDLLPGMTQLASARFGVPVEVGSANVGLFPTPYVALQDVRVGKGPEATAATIKAFPTLGFLLGRSNVVRSVSIDTVAAVPEAFPVLFASLRKQQADGIEIERVLVNDVELKVPGVALPRFDADVTIDPEAAFNSARITALSGRLSIDLTNEINRIRVAVQASDWTPPLGAKITFQELRMSGTARNNQVQFPEIEYRLYGGNGRGSLSASWEPIWDVRGTFQLNNAQLKPIMEAITRGVLASGRVATQVSYAMQARALASIFDAPVVNANFTLKDGELEGVDLLSALQSTSRLIVQGGKTHFDQFQGSLALAGQTYQYRDLTLRSGPLSAAGQASVAPTRQLNGQLKVELVLPNGTVTKSSYAINGNLDGVMLQR